SSDVNNAGVIAENAATYAASPEQNREPYPYSAADDTAHIDQAGTKGPNQDGVPQSNGNGFPQLADAQGHVPVPISAVIELVISPERETEIVTKALLTILKKHHGSTMVFLKLMGSRRRIRLDPSLYVNGQDMTLQDELKDLLGENAFRVKEI
ncbi:MAG: hypothetical protein IJV18_09380, partial [Acidaminococcaceae bacterium]|nr:hypothetical protein [Acidaminococcaceae bacterium]